jgi:hypothetical protein
MVKQLQCPHGPPATAYLPRGEPLIDPPIAHMVLFNVTGLEDDLYEAQAEGAEPLARSRYDAPHFIHGAARGTSTAACARPVVVVGGPCTGSSGNAVSHRCPPL